MTLDANTLYIGGAFDTIGGQVRNRIAALDATTGRLTTWNPNADNTVWQILPSGDVVYVGGTFAHIGGQGRVCIAQLDARTGLATDWQLDAAGTRNLVAYTAALDDKTLYLGGGFEGI